jgi:hypothetical protein
VVTELDAHAADRIAPIGETQRAEGTDLEQIGRTRRQICD